MEVGVIGARGRLGSAIMDTLKRIEDIQAVAIEVPSAELDAVINAAPLPDACLHREALSLGCHVVDVTIAPDPIRQMLTLDELAQQHGLCLITMAGLAPGLTGLLAKEMLQRCPETNCVQVSLLQSTSGTSGKQGTLDMLDLLTSPGCQFAQRPYPQSDQPQASKKSLFDFANPELIFLPEAAKLRLVTGFDSDNLNRMILALGWIRKIFPIGYDFLRGLVAQSKATAKQAVDESIEIGAINLDRAGNVLDGRCLKFDSDYGVTAAIASAITILAIQSLPTSGAGHLSQFVTLDTLLNHPVVKSHWLNG